MESNYHGVHIYLRPICLFFYLFPTKRWSCSHSFFFFFFFIFWPPWSIWSSQARDQIQATSVTYATSVAVIWSFDLLCWARNQMCILSLQRCHWCRCAPQWELHLALTFCKWSQVNNQTSMYTVKWWWDEYVSKLSGKKFEEGSFFLHQNLCPVQ